MEDNRKYQQKDVLFFGGGVFFLGGGRITVNFLEVKGNYGYPKSESLKIQPNSSRVKRARAVVEMKSTSVIQQTGPRPEDRFRV